MRIFSLRLFRILTTALLLLGSGATYGMSVLAPTFDELVAESDLVVRGVVTDVHCIAVDTAAGTAIKTLVTLHVERTLKGSPGADVTLSFLGGRIGRRTLTVVGMPAFKPGDRQIVFVAHNGKAICPLVAAGYGRYHVRHDATTGRDYVARDDGAPLQSTDQIVQAFGQGSASTATGSGAMSAETFEARITSALAGAPSPLQP